MRSHQKKGQLLKPDAAPRRTPHSPHPHIMYLLDILQINISKYNLKLVNVNIRGLDQSRPVLDCDIVRRRGGTGTKYPLSSPHVKTCLIRQTLN